LRYFTFLMHLPFYSTGSSTKQVRIDVLESRADRYESCTGIWEDLTGFRMSWNVTKIGQVAISPCPAGFEGTAQKKCGRSESQEVGQWKPTDFSRCSHFSLVQINSTVSIYIYILNTKATAMYPPRRTKFVYTQHFWVH